MNRKEVTFYRDESDFAKEVEKSLMAKIKSENLPWDLEISVSGASHKIPILTMPNSALRGYYEIVTELNLDYV